MNASASGMLQFFFSIVLEFFVDLPHQVKLHSREMVLNDVGIYWEVLFLFILLAVMF